MRRRALLKISSSEIDISTAVVTASAQTYSGSALTPTPTVTLNGSTVPSTGYDVTYSNNVNAGTGNITVTGKNGYRGTATGTFTINKASRTISFSDVYNVVAPSGTITKTATPSAGSGDGAITYTISSTTYATINSSTGAVTAKTSDGSATVTATVADGTNYLSASASYTLYVFSTIHNFDYTGTVQSLLLPPGSYTLQVWGAQGGSNAAASSYGITSKAGGKGGYSTGQLTLSSERTVYAFVGGQGSSSGNGGWNGGGGSSSGSSSYSATSSGTTTLGVSTFGCGGGATDIALTTSDMSYSSYRNARSSASLLSRIIVAGGGSGGAMRCTRTTTTTTITDRSVSSGLLTDTSYNGDSYSSNKLTIAAGGSYSSKVLTLTDTHSEQSSSDATSSQVGYVGGGSTGGGYSSSYYGSQTAAGTNGAFGFGANQSSTSYRYSSGCGGAGWYGGGSAQNNSTTGYVSRSGGGSGFVNTSASAGNRPSGYTGLQLDSGTTYTGASSFPSPSGSNETGHSGNGYARITRL